MTMKKKYYLTKKKNACKTGPAPKDFEKYVVIPYQRKFSVKNIKL